MLRHCSSDFGHDRIQDRLAWYEKLQTMILHCCYVLFRLTIFTTRRYGRRHDGNGLLTIVDAVVACGVDHDALFQDETQAQRLATDIFGNQFTACLDVTFKELDGHFKTYTDLTAAQGQIQSRPGVRKNMKAFVQWTRDPRCSCR